MLMIHVSKAIDLQAGQEILNITDKWLSWSGGMRAKIEKCLSAAIKSTTGHIIDPQLLSSLYYHQVLWVPIKLPQDCSHSKIHVERVLDTYLTDVDQCRITIRQKLKL